MLKILSIAFLTLGLLVPYSTFAAAPIPEADGPPSTTTGGASARDARLERGRILMVQGRHDEARDIFQQVLEEDPDDVRVHRLLGQLAFREQRPEDGIRALQGAIERAPGDPSLVLELGTAYEEMGRMEDAEQVYRDLLAQDEGVGEAWFRLGRMATRTNRPDEAIAAFARVASDPSAPAPQARAAREALDTLYTARVDAWVAGLASGEAGIGDAVSYGRRLVSGRRFPDAQRLFEAVVERAPDDAQARYWLGRVLITQRSFDEGLEQLERSTASAPDNLALRTELAKSYDVAGRLDDAARAFASVLEETNDPGLAADAGRRLALVNARRAANDGDPEQALSIYRRLLAQTPEDLRLLELTTPLLEELGRHDEADRIFQALLGQYPDDVGLRMRLAAIHERRGDAESARAYYAQVLAMDPQGELATLALERLGLNEAVELLHSGRAGEAVPILDRILEHVPASAVVIHARGMALHRLGRLEDAEAAYREVLELSPDNEFAWLELGQLFEEMGRTDEAIDAYERLEVLAVGDQQRAAIAPRLNALYAQRRDALVADLERGEAAVGAVVELGSTLVRRGFHDDAADLLRMTLEQAPDDGQVHAWLARAELGRGEIERGLAMFEQASRLAPGDTQLSIELARLYEQVGRDDEAERAWQDAVRRVQDEDARAMAERGLGLLQARRLQEAGDPAGALAVFERLRAHEPDNLAMLLLHGRQLISMDRADEAEDIFVHALVQAPSNVGLYLQIAQIYRETGESEVAERLYREVLAPPSGPGVAIVARLSLAAMYQEGGRFEDAFRELEAAREETAGTPQEQRVVAARDDLTAAVIEQGRGAMAAQEFETAESLFRLLLERRPDHIQARFGLSEVYRTQGDHARQAEQLAEIVARNPENAAMKRRLALAHDDAGQFDEAEAALREVVEAFPLDGEARARLAALHERRGRTAEAQAGYIRLAELGSADEWHRVALDRLGLEEARELAGRGAFDRALAAVRRVQDSVPPDAFVALSLARIHGQAGHTEEAEVAYEEALRLAPGDAEARMGLARLYARSGREAEAIAAFSAIASATPPSPRSAEAREELDLLLLARARREIERAEAADNAAAAVAGLIPFGVEAFEFDSLDAARAVFEQAVRLEPDNAAAHYWLGRVYAGQDEHADAIVVLRRAVDLEPGSALYQRTLGVAYQAMEIDRLAAESLEAAVALAPDDAAAHLALARFHRDRGDEAAARARFVRVLELAADRETVAAALDGLGFPEDPDQLEREEVEEALRSFEQYLTGPPRAPQVRLYVAVIHHRALQLEDAERLYNQILASPAVGPQVALRLARLYAETGRVDEAVALLDRVIAVSGDPRLAGLAGQQQTAIYAREAEALAAAFDRGEGDVGEARRLGRILVERGAFDAVVPMLERATAHAPDDPLLWYSLGRAASGLGDFEPGHAALERAVELAPGNHLLLQHLAMAYEAGGRTEAAISIYERLAVQTTDPPIQGHARMRLGLIRGARFATAGEFEAALREYEALLEHFPDDVTARAERGRMLVALGREAEADAEFERVLELAPNSPGVRLRLAEVFSARGETARAMEQLAAVVRIAPLGAEANQARALLGLDAARQHLAEGEPAEAEAILDRMLGVLQDDPLTRYHLGEAYFQQRRFSEAEAQYIEARRDLPGLPDVHLALARLYDGLDRRESAIRSYERVLELGRNTEAARQAQPALSAHYGARVQAMFAEGRREEAMLGLQKLVGSDPANVPARTTLAALYTEAQQYDDALRELEFAARVQPDNPRIQDQIASVHATRGQDMLAAEAYARAISMERDESQATRYVRGLVMALARHMVDSDRPFAAIRHLRALNEHGIGDERTYFTLAAIYRQQGRAEEALRAFREAVRFAPDNVVMRYNLAELYERNSDFDLALVQYLHIVRAGEPGDRVVEEARRRAAALRNRLALFTSQLSYSTTVGEANIEEQDLTGTGAINTDFSSQLFYNLGTNFWPTTNLNLRLDTGLAYIANHSTERDTLVPRFGLAGNLNYPLHFYSASAHVSEIYELISDRYQGRSYSANLSAGLRFTDARDLLQGLGWRQGRGEEHGEARIDIGPGAGVVASDPGVENPALRGALAEAWRERLLADAPATGDEGVRRYQVREGDRLRDIAAALGIDVRVWEEGWRDSPSIVDPSHVLPGDIVMVSGPADDPAIAIEQRGRTGVVTAGDALRPEERLALEARIDASVETGMASYRTGLEMLRQGRLDAARVRFEEVLGVVPDDAQILLHLGTVYRDQDRPLDAARAWRAALEQEPALVRARLGLAQLAADAGDYGAAAAMVADLTRPDASQGLFEELAALGVRAATGIAGQPTQTDVEVEHLVRAADGLSAAGEHEAARRILESVLDDWPFHAEANHVLARVLREQGRAQEALQFADRSARLGHDEMRYGLGLARALRDAGDLARAEEAYRHLLDLAEDGGSAEAARREAEMLRAARLETAGDAAGAMALLGELLVTGPDDVPLLEQAAMTAAGAGRTDEAADLLGRAIELAPGRFDLRLRLAGLFREAGRDEPADAALAAAMGAASDPAQRREVLDRLGFEGALGQIRRGRWSQAMTALERIQAVVPDAPLVLLNIGVVRQQQRRYPEAEAVFQQVLDQDDRNLTARLRLGLLYSETDQVDRAIVLLEQVASAGAGQDAGRRATEVLQGLEERRLRRLVGDEVEQTAPTMKTLQARLFYNDTELPARSLTETFSYGANLTFFYRSLRWGDWILNYTFGTRENEDPLGTDYAYVWNDVGVTWRTSVPNFRGWFGDSENIPGLTGSIALAREWRRYTFADTNALNALTRAQRREHNTDTLTLGLNYQPPGYERMGFFLSYTRGRSRANLPVGILFSPDGIPVAFQSRGLGDFDPSFVTAGMSFQF